MSPDTFMCFEALTWSLFTLSWFLQVTYHLSALWKVWYVQTFAVLNCTIIYTSTLFVKHSSGHSSARGLFTNIALILILILSLLNGHLSYRGICSMFGWLVFPKEWKRNKSLLGNLGDTTLLKFWKEQKKTKQNTWTLLYSLLKNWVFIFSNFIQIMIFL